MPKFTLITGSAGIGKSALAQSIPLDRCIIFACGGEARRVAPNAISTLVTQENVKRIGQFLCMDKVQNFIIDHNLVVIFDSLTELRQDLTAKIQKDCKGAVPEIRDWAIRSTNIGTLLLALKMLANYVPVIATLGHSYYRATKDDPVAGYKIDLGNNDEDILYQCDDILTLYKGGDNKHYVLSPHYNTQVMPAYNKDMPQAAMYERKFRSTLDEFTGEEMRMQQFASPDIKMLPIEGAGARYDFMCEYLNYCGYDYHCPNFAKSDSEEFREERKQEFARALIIKNKFNTLKNGTSAA